MAQYVTYDKSNNILFVDYSNQTITTDLFDQVVAETGELAAQLTQRVYFLACMKNTKVSPEVQAIWGKYTQQILQYVKGVVRYEATDVVTNVTIRSNTVRYHVQGNNSHIYPTREAALAAIRQMEQNENKVE